MATGTKLTDDNTPAAAKRKFAEASEALREARSRLCDRNGKRTRGRRGRRGRQCAAPRTLIPSGAAAHRGTTPRCGQPRYAYRGEYEDAQCAALAAFREVAAAARSITAQARSDYDLVYKVVGCYGRDTHLTLVHFSTSSIVAARGSYVVTRDRDPIETAPVVHFWHESWAQILL
eukprot:SAG11_NODE_8564_length_1000_cov_1.154273_1_plen_175_part_00